MFQSVDGEEELNEEEVRHHGPIETLGTPIAGRGHVSLRTILDSRHSERSRSTRHSLIIILSKEA